jgi:competence protein ComEC
VAVVGVLVAASGAPLKGRRLGWLALVPLFAPFAAPVPHGAAKLVVLDVGHGLAVIVETREHRLLFDAGPTFRSGYDSGADVVVPALGATSSLGLDRLIVSHGDNDHAGGAPAVAAAFPHAALLRGPDHAAAGGVACVRGQRWEWDGVGFAILHPPPGLAGSANDTSCVLKIVAAGGTALVTGDIETRAERRLLVERAELAADIVVVPHHGSATSSTAPFVAAVGARHAIVSAGYANRWGFPRPDVRSRWEEAGAEMRVTGDSGALTVVLGARAGDDIAITAERDARHHYWQTSAP